MRWFNAERLKKILTFPVETVNLLNDGTGCVDKEWEEFTAQMWSEGASFFCYTSDSVDALASCCYGVDTKVLVKDSKGVHLDSFFNLKMKNSIGDTIKVFNNGKWSDGTLVELPPRDMYKVVTANGKEMLLTDNHRNNCLGGTKLTKDLTTDDYIMFNTSILEPCEEDDENLTYDQGREVGKAIGRALSPNGKNLRAIANGDIITKWTYQTLGYLRPNMNCLAQSVDFRRGIIDGWVNYTGGQTYVLDVVEDIDAIYTSLGIITKIDKQEEDYNTLYSLTVYSDGDMKTEGSKTYVKIKSVEPFEQYNSSVYCFEMTDKDDDKFTLPNGIHNYNCRLRNSIESNVFSYTLGAGGLMTGSKGVITININRLVQDVAREHDGKENITLDDISLRISEQVSKIHKYLTAWNEILKESLNAKMLPVYDANYIDLSKQYLTMGINGFVEGAEFLGIEPTPNDDYFAYGEAILKPIFDLNRQDRTEEIMFNTEFVPGENLGDYYN